MWNKIKSYCTKDNGKCIVFVLLFLFLSIGIVQCIMKLPTPTEVTE